MIKNVINNNNKLKIGNKDTFRLCFFFVISKPKMFTNKEISSVFFLVEINLY